jgi:hypothetical protein
MERSIKKRKSGNNNRGWSALKSPSGKLFSGVLNGNGLIVGAEQDVKDLWFHGCYGKGLMSRSRADRLAKHRKEDYRKSR